MTAGRPRLYEDLAPWWPLLSAPAEYEEEAAVYARTLIDAARGPVRSVLELGSGGGNNASHLKHRFTMTLVDRAPAMLAVSTRLNPECEHVTGDMRTVRLDRTFDAVFVHDAVSYITTPPDLAATITTAFLHCRPGGAALFVPDHVRETFRPSTGHGGHDAEDAGLRYLEWVRDPDPGDHEYVVDFAYLLRSGDDVTVEFDRHVCGLFGRNEWLSAIKTAGFAGSATSAVLDTGEELEMFVAVRPG